MNHRRRLALALVIAVAGGIAAFACREGPTPFEQPGSPFPTEGARQLTFSPGSERSPAWSPGGDSVYYVGDGWEGLPPSGGVLLAVPKEGGTATELLNGAQIAAFIPLTLRTPAVDPGGRQIAFAISSRILSPQLCGVTRVRCETSAPVSSLAPTLAQVLLVARSLDASRDISADPSLTIDFAGRTLDDTRHPYNLPGVWIIDYYPFQRLFYEDSLIPYRPSWAPDGARVVFSDGVELRIWGIAGGSSTPVPNTQDGVAPAWSPDGRWIAYTRLERGAATQNSCVHYTLTQKGDTSYVCVEDRTDYPILGRHLALVHPDGSGGEDVADGEEPAWTPDGQALVFRRAGQLWRVGVDGSGEARIPGTSDGREPAVSPDGSEVAFARANAAGGYDIWVVPMPGGGSP